VLKEYYGWLLFIPHVKCSHLNIYITWSLQSSKLFLRLFTDRIQISYENNEICDCDGFLFFLFSLLFYCTFIIVQSRTWNVLLHVHMGSLDGAPNLSIVTWYTLNYDRYPKLILVYSCLKWTRELKGNFGHILDTDKINTLTVHNLVHTVSNNYTK
jgi:hypothetical protein